MLMTESQEPTATLDLTQAAEFCKCSTRLLRQLASAGTLPATKVGRKWVFPTRLLQEWIEERARANVGRKPRFGAMGRTTIAQALTAGGTARFPGERVRVPRDAPLK
jgi:excisionase family DNA binding protein